MVLEILWRLYSETEQIYTSDGFDSSELNMFEDKRVEPTR